MRSTLRLNSINENQSNGKIMQGEQIANATGVLIESLLQQLCTMLEGDEVRRNKLYYGNQSANPLNVIILIHRETYFC